MADKYLDATATFDGDGTTSAQAASGGAAGAWNTLAGKALSSGDVVWCRRCSTGVTALGASLSLTTAGTKIVGWPISGDELYSTRPVGAQASWDGDVATEFVMRFTGAFSFTCGATSGTAMEFHRVHYRGENSASTTNILGIFQGPTTGTITRTRFVSCKFTSTNGLSGSSSSVLMSFKDCIELFGCTIAAASIATSTSRAVNFNNTNTTAGGHQLVRNTTITCTGASGGTGSSGFVRFDGADGYHAWQDVTITAAASFGWSNGLLVTFGDGATSALGLFDGVTVDATNSTTTSGKSVSFGHPRAIFRRITLTNVTLSNTANVFAELEIIGWTEASVNAAQTFRGSLLVISGTTRYASNASAFNCNAMNAGIRMVTLARKVTWPVLPTLQAAGAGNESVLYSIDHSGTAGNFYMSSANMRGQSTSVARTGGFASSIKVESLAAVSFAETPMEIGLPERETMLFAVATAAAKTLTMYGAYKSFTNGFSNAPTLDHIWIEVRYLDGSRYRQVAMSRSTSTRRGALTSDASSWTGDTGLTSFKLEVPFTTGVASTIASVRILAGWPNSEGGIIYIDPQLVLS